MRLRVDPAGSGTAYDIVVERGALETPEAWLAAAGGSATVAIISDATVATLHGARLLERVRAAGVAADLFTFPPGEVNKTRATWEALSDALLAAGIGRDGCVIALGGGVTGDLAGFVAATYLRGIPVIQLPTTLLAMVDAAIGGKTGVDTRHGKNLIGAFHQPKLVLADTAALDTLPVDVLADGFAEAVKHAAIADADHLQWIDEHAAALRARDAAAIDALVARSAAIKAAAVVADPHEHGVRATLNFGHTVAHALEMLTHYELSHGRAVAAGMVAEARIGEAAGLTQHGSADALAATLAALGVPHRLPETDAAAIVAACAGDKKSRGGRVRYTMLERIGRCAATATGRWTHDLDDSLVIAALNDSITRDASV